ncbi:desulfoferrodoxin [candidate division WOR-3 bacterium]|nr:desulfoferrodoxin [candidate division WOR-3 bacterium]
MDKTEQVYNCDDCGDMIEVVKEGCGNYSCHGEPMKLLENQTADWKNENHVPLIEKIDSGFRVIVRSTLHPMEADHCIEWIEATDEAGYVYRKHLEPGGVPETTFMIDIDRVVDRKHCNINGIWKGAQIL